MSIIKRKKDVPTERDQAIIALFLRKYLAAAALAAARAKEAYRSNPTAPGFFERSEYWRHAVGYGDWLISHLGAKIDGYDSIAGHGVE